MIPKSLLTTFAYGVAVLAASTVQPRSNFIETIIMDALDSLFGRVAGAAFFMTNEPTGNFIVASALSSSGQVKFNRAVSTRGVGAHGISDPIGVDPLFAQGAVQVSQNGQFLAVVNSGSNTVSAFSIDPRNPLEIEQIGQPVSSEGEFPMSLAISEDGKRVCVLNGGAVAGVNCFAVDKQRGLTALPNTLRALELGQTTPPSGPPGAASNLIFSEDGTKLVASIKGRPPTPGFLAVWEVAADGSLSKDFVKVSPAAGGMLPFSMNPIPGKNALFATDAGVGFAIFDLSPVGSATNTTSPRDSVVPIEGQMASCWSSRSAKTGNFFITDVGTSTVTEVHVDENLKGTIVKQFPQDSRASTSDNSIVTLDGKEFMLILEPGTTSIRVLTIPGPGQAKGVGTFNFAQSAKRAGLTINTVNLQGMATFITQH